MRMRKHIWAAALPALRARQAQAWSATPALTNDMPLRFARGTRYVRRGRTASLEARMATARLREHRRGPRTEEAASGGAPRTAPMLATA